MIEISAELLTCGEHHFFPSTEILDQDAYHRLPMQIGSSGVQHEVALAQRSRSRTQFVAQMTPVPVEISGGLEFMARCCGGPGRPTSNGASNV